MGYLTRFELNIIRGDAPEYDKVDETLMEIIGEEDWLPFEDSCKWYDHEKHMIKLSTYFPDAVFKLSGWGEEAGDIWVKYFCNGKAQIEPTKIILPEFDKDKLK